MPRPAAVLLTAVLIALATASAATSLEEHETSIYSALINHGLAGAAKMIVIAAETTGDPAAIAAQDDAPAMLTDLGVPAETLLNWQQRNARRSTIDQPLNLSATYQLLDAEDRAELFANVEPAAGWSQFFARYPDAPGLLRLSRAGFDDSLMHALVYVEYQCGEVCGSGRLVHLSNEHGDGWQVLGAALVWMVE